ncbi:MAG: hypothetical protein U0936_19890 [Planctomycetaceae bacterium]
MTTDAAGNATFSTDITAAVAVGEYVSATATDASGNTSEFSANKIIVAPIPVLDLDADDSSGETEPISSPVMWKTEVQSMWRMLMRSRSIPIPPASTG